MATYNTTKWFAPKPRGPHVLYLRCSHRPHSKLSIENQRADAATLLARGRAKIVEVFIEEDPLSGGDRPALERAIAYCKDHGTRLIIGKIHRMRGGFGWLKRLKDEHVYFMAADVPQINSTEFYRLNWQERDRTDAVSRTIRHALAQSKAEGTALGGKRQNAEGLKLGPAASAVARRQKAKWRSQSTMLKIALLRHRGITTLTGIATRLNQMKHPAPRGGQWSSAQVRAVIKRCEN